MTSEGNERRESAVKAHVERRLRKIFGDTAYSCMTEKERTIGEQVVRWEEGLHYEKVLAQAVLDRRRDVVEILWDVVGEKYGVLADAIRASSRNRIVVDARAIMYRVLWETTYVPKNHIAEELGIKQDHSTVLHALKKADDLLLYDAVFRSDYEEVIGEVRKRMQENGLQESLQI